MQRQAASRVARVAVPAVIAAWLFMVAGAAAAAPDPKAEAKRLNPTEVTQGLSAVHEAQRGLATAVGDLRTQIDELRRAVEGLQGDLRQLRELTQGGIEHNKDMREEVRGLYVESSGLKGDIAQTGKQVDALAQELGSFRWSSGIIIAIVIVLQLVVIGLTFRGRSGL